MAGLFMNQNIFQNQQGFVLSFSTFALALFLVIFAQIQHSHMQSLQFDALDVYQSGTPGRVLRDIALDFNALTGQTIRVDQNRTHASIHFSGTNPNPLSHTPNLLRYQTKLFTLARDFNTTILMDWNQTIADGNLSGRTNHDLVWKEKLDASAITFQPFNQNFYPTRIDVNIISDDAYGGVPQLQTGGVYATTDFIFTFNYSDTNAAHSSSGTLNMDKDQYIIYQYTYSLPDGSVAVKTLDMGSEDFYKLILDGDANINWRYSISYLMPNDSNGTKVGYDVNMSIRGMDFNADTNTLWTWGG